MPYVIIKVDGKDSKALKQIPMTKTEIGRLKNGLSCYTIISVATHRVSHVGACKNPTPEDRWDGAGGFLSKLFGKKKAKRNPMSRRVYMEPTGRGSYKVRMAGARRRRRRR